jgi:hypothetical protein
MLLYDQRSDDDYVINIYQALQFASLGDNQWTYQLIIYQYKSKPDFLYKNHKNEMKEKL